MIGKPLHLTANFQHLHRDFLYLQLTQALKKSSNRNNIFIDMGGLFKEIANEKIIFKHKISVLNQVCAQGVTISVTNNALKNN